MSDMLQEALIKLLLSKTREAGESIKPGVERSGTPGLTVVESRAREACGSAKKGDLLQDEWLSPTSWALLLCATDPGVPLRSTPGFMLTPRFAGSKQTLRRLDQSFLQLVVNIRNTQAMILPVTSHIESSQHCDKLKEDLIKCLRRVASV